MNQEILTQLANRSLNEPIYSDPRFPPSLYYRFLKLLATELKPNLSVELGVCGGGGSLHLCLGWGQGTVVGVDVSWDYPENIEHIQGTQSNFIFYRGDSIQAAKEVHDVYGGVDILFCDTRHEYEFTTNEFHTWRPYLSDGAVVCMDDFNRKEMSGVWEHLLNYAEGVRLDYLHPGGTEGGFGAFFNVKR
jgi:predicted O-methyltransferase YrrM